MFAPGVKADDVGSTEFIMRCRNGLNNISALTDYMFCAGFVTGARNAVVVMGSAPFCEKAD